MPQWRVNVLVPRNAKSAHKMSNFLGREGGFRDLACFGLEPTSEGGNKINK